MNLGKEKHKSGIGIEHVDDFYYYCSKELKINIIDGHESTVLGIAGEAMEIFRTFSL